MNHKMLFLFTNKELETKLEVTTKPLQFKLPKILRILLIFGMMNCK